MIKSLFFILLVISMSTFSSINVDAHGFLLKPMSRNYYSHIQGREPCPECLNAGGVALVKKSSIKNQWPSPETEKTSVRHGLCGDAVNQRQIYMDPIPESKATLEVGKDFEIQVFINSHHNGYFEFSLCNLDIAGSLKQSCLALLERSPYDPSESPIDSKHPERYYLQPKCASQFDGLGQGTVTMRYKIPAHFITGDNYVLQWHWVTGNTCRGPDYPTSSFFPKSYEDCEGDGGSIGWLPTRGECIKKNLYPEEFWNCADVRLIGNTKPTSKPNGDKRKTSKPTKKNNNNGNNKTYKPTQSPTKGQPCAKVWEQCGGKNFNNAISKCCEAGTYCNYQSEWYSQCIPPK